MGAFFLFFLSFFLLHCFKYLCSNAAIKYGLCLVPIKPMAVWEKALLVAVLFLGYMCLNGFTELGNVRCLIRLGYVEANVSYSWFDLCLGKDLLLISAQSHQLFSLQVKLVKFAMDSSAAGWCFCDKYSMWCWRCTRSVQTPSILLLFLRETAAMLPKETHQTMASKPKVKF